MIKKAFVNIVGFMLVLFASTFAWAEISVEEEGPDIYGQEVKQLTTLECARCHYTVFSDIRDQGGAHRLACRKCHVTFHTNKPGKDWKDVVPDCNSCHKQYHGKEFPDCLRCHANAHAPVASLDIEKMTNDCTACHKKQAAETKKYSSEHAEMACNACHHSRHGYLPKCTECHEKPHAPYTNNAGCMGCHPPHSPLEILYTENTANEVCAGCHDAVVAKLAGSDKEHTFLKCAFCHAAKHKFIPTCQSCHENGPHREDLLKKFKGCGDCHGDAHLLRLQAK
ncbi:MAG: hypothetical protein JW786_10865 [Desulfobacterales bacterium]|nr:hypothetical protein [Desulfobacterales bacterium]